MLRFHRFRNRHQSLRWLQKLEEPSGRLGKWLFELQQYDFAVRASPKRSLNHVADAFSRQPEMKRRNCSEMQVI